MSSSCANRFVLLCQSRTGGTLMGSLLASHPDIFWAGEYFKRVKHWRGIRRLLRPLIRRYPWYYLSFLAKRESNGKPVFGHKLTPTYVKNAEHTVSYLKRHGWLILYLWRRDAFHAALSQMVARRMNHWQTLQDRMDVVPSFFTLTFEPQDVLATMKQREKREQQLLLALAGIPHLEFVYEDDLLGPDRWQNTADRVFDALCLTRIQVNTRVQKTWDRPYVEIITNYTELVDAFGDHQFSGVVKGMPA